jgi:hypothetical protein
MAQREDAGNGAENDIAKVSEEDVKKGVDNLTIHGENNGEPAGPVRDDLYDEPEDLNTQTVIQNRYCFWCHRRGGKTSVRNLVDSSFLLLMLSFLLLCCRIIMKRV